MKLTKTLCYFGAVLALSLAPLGVYAQANDSQDSCNVCSREQCEDIVDDAIERYNIIVLDVDEYKDYVWSEVQTNSLSSTDLETKFRETFEHAAERLALNEARASDETINTAAEVITILDEINQENHTGYILGTGEFASRADYLDELHLNHDAFKSQLEYDLVNATPDGIAEHLGIENLNQTIPGSGARTVREEVSQTSSGILINSTTNDNTIVHGYLNSVVFSVSGDPGSFTYERFLSHGISDYGSARSGSYTFSGSVGDRTARLHVQGYINLVGVYGDVPFIAG